MKYRGYDIEYTNHWLWRISKDGKFICAQPSEEFAKKWIDEAIGE